MDRFKSAQIDYPFVYPVPPLDADKVAGILDCLLYVSPDDALIVYIPTSTIVGGGAEAYSYLQDISGQVTLSIAVFVASDADLIDTGIDIPDGALVAVGRNFVFTPDPSLGIQTVLGDDGRSVIVIDHGKLTPPGEGAYPMTAVVEPGRIVPCRRRVTAISLYNEYRESDPNNRAILPPDGLVVTVPEGGTVVLNDGYNCEVTYDEDTQTLRLTGGAGFGLGLPPTTPWDDTDEDFEAGARSINGINLAGVVPVEPGDSVYLDALTVGKLDIIIRNQGNN